MSALNRGMREIAGWLLPFAAVATVLGMEWHWRATPAAPAAPSDVAARPVEPGLLPEFAIPGGVESRRETVERTLFNPTRRPAPAPNAPEPAKPRIQRGQFVLTGTTVVDGKSTAFLREVNGGKSRRVNQGETINGLTVTEVKPDRVRLTLGDESEELTLRVVANPRPTPAAVQHAAAAPGAAPGAPGAPGQAVPAPQAAVNPDPNVQSLIERRRAMRAAAMAGQVMDDDPNDPKDPRTIAAQKGAQQTQPVQQPIVAPPAPPAPSASGQVTFEEMYRRRYQQR